MILAFNDGVSRRGLLLQIALIAYWLDHEEYPDRLEELAPDYLAKVPLDPYSQAPFEYRAEGLDLPLRTPELAPNTPLFWSVGVMQLLLRKQIADLNGWNNSPGAMGEGYGYGGSYGGEYGGGYGGGYGGEYGGGYGSDFEDDEEVSEEIPEEIPEPEMVYEFHSTNSYWGYQSRGYVSKLVFPLPTQKAASNSN